MKTISKRVLLRLAAQADEADIYGDEKVAFNLTKQIEKYASSKTRSDDEDYKYSKEELAEDLGDMFWDAAVRIFDYYDETPDTKQIQEIVDFEMENFLTAVEGLIHKDIGPHEPPSPGEEKDDGQHEVNENLFEMNDESEDEYEVDKNDDDDDEEDE